MPGNSEPTPDGALQPARRALTDAISALIDPQPVRCENRTGWTDSLYQQLTAAVYGVQGQPSTSPTRSPAFVDALDETRRIDQTVRSWHPGWPLGDETYAPDRPPPPVTVLRLRAIDARTWRPQDTGLVTDIAATINTWVKRITELLAPEPVIHLYDPDSPEPAACTACGTRRVWRKDPTNPKAKVMQPALQVTTRGCVCQSCRAAWEPGQLRMLAAAIGYPLPQGVLE